MKSFFTRIVTSFVLVFTGGILLANAQTISSVKNGFSNLGQVIDTFSQTVVVATGTLLMALAVVVFFLGIVQYVWGLRTGDSGKAKMGSSFMAWGLLALFVMFSVYGIVKLAQGIFFDKTDVTTITIPDIKFQTKTGTSSAGNSVCIAVSGACSNPCSMGGGVTGTCNSFDQCCR